MQPEQQHRINEMVDRFRDIRRELDEANTEIRSANLEVESPDRTVRATVAGGQLIDLWISPEIYRRPDSGRLAQTVLETVSQAHRAFQEQVNARYRAVLGPNFDIADLANPPNEDEAQDRIRETSRHLFGTG